MHHAFGVGIRQRVGYLPRDARGVPNRETAIGARGQELPQARAIDAAHHDVEEIGRLPDFVDGHDVRMLQARDGLGFAHEAVRELRGRGARRIHHLDRHIAVQRTVPDTEHDGKAALAEHRADGELLTQGLLQAPLQAGRIHHAWGAGRGPWPTAPILESFSRMVIGEKRKVVRRVALGLVAFALVWLFGVWPPPVWWRSHWPAQTAMMRLRDSAITYQPSGLSQFSPVLQRMVIIGEDSRFRTHHGLDIEEIRDALGIEPGAGVARTLRTIWRRRDRLRGASTITQQVAKNLYLSPSRNPLRKLKEAVTAVRLELALSKDRILEIYLNVVELGPGVWGMSSASTRYFGTKPGLLTEAQAAALAATLPFPLSSNPSFRSARMLHRRDSDPGPLSRSGRLYPAGGGTARFPAAADVHATHYPAGDRFAARGQPRGAAAGLRGRRQGQHSELVDEPQRHDECQIARRVIPPYRLDRRGALGRLEREPHLVGRHVLENLEQVGGIEPDLERLAVVGHRRARPALRPGRGSER